MKRVIYFTVVLRSLAEKRSHRTDSALLVLFISLHHPGLSIIDEILLAYHTVSYESYLCSHSRSTYCTVLLHKANVNRSKGPLFNSQLHPYPTLPSRTDIAPIPSLSPLFCPHTFTSPLASPLNAAERKKVDLRWYLYLRRPQCWEPVHGGCLTRYVMAPCGIFAHIR